MNVQQTSTQTPRSSRPAIAVIAWLRLVRVFQKVSRASEEHLRKFNLNLAQFDVLAHIGAAEGLTQQEVADSLLVTKSNVCQLLDRMEHRGLVQRKPRGRTNELYLTITGRELYDRVVPAHERLIAEQLSTLSPGEQVQLLSILRKVDRALD